MAPATLGEPLRIRVPGKPVTFLPIKGRNLRGTPRDTKCLQVVRATPLGGDVGSLGQRQNGSPGLATLALLCRS